SALSRGPARMAAFRDVDRVLPALLPSPCERLPLPGLCPGGGAPRAKANATSCHHDDLTRVRATPAIRRRASAPSPLHGLHTIGTTLWCGGLCPCLSVGEGLRPAPTQSRQGWVRDRRRPPV